MNWKEFLAQKDEYVGRKITCDKTVVFSTTGIITNIFVEGNMLVMNYQKDNSSNGFFSADMNYFMVVFDKRTGQTVIQPNDASLLITFRIERKK